MYGVSKYFARSFWVDNSLVGSYFRAILSVNCGKNQARFRLAHARFAAISDGPLHFSVSQWLAYLIVFVSCDWPKLSLGTCLANCHCFICTLDAKTRSCINSFIFSAYWDFHRSLVSNCVSNWAFWWFLCSEPSLYCNTLTWLSHWLGKKELLIIIIFIFS